MTTNGTRGAAFERTTRARLEAEGWHCVRSAGSRGPADLYAFRDGDVWLVQCKIGGRLGPAERDELVNLAAVLSGGPLKVTPILAVRGPRGTPVVLSVVESQRRKPILA